MKNTTKAVLGGLALGGAVVFVLYERQRRLNDLAKDMPKAYVPTPVASLAPVGVALDRGNPTTGISPGSVQWGWTGRH